MASAPTGTISSRSPTRLGRRPSRTPPSPRPTPRTPATWPRWAANGSACATGRLPAWPPVSPQASPVLDAFIDAELDRLRPATDRLRADGLQPGRHDRPSIMGCAAPSRRAASWPMPAPCSSRTAWSPTAKQRRSRSCWCTARTMPSWPPATPATPSRPCALPACPVEARYTPGLGHWIDRDGSGRRCRLPAPGCSPQYDAAMKPTGAGLRRNRTSAIKQPRVLAAHTSGGRSPSFGRVVVCCPEGARSA